MWLDEAVGTVRSRPDCAAFVRTLLGDLKDNPDEWENTTLEDYLEAVAAWIEDMPGYYKNEGKPVARGYDRSIGEVVKYPQKYLLFGLRIETRSRLIEKKNISRSNP